MDLAGFQDEVGFLWLLLLNGGVLGCLLWITRRIVADRATAAADALGLWYLVQYAAVTVPGVLGVLTAGTMTGAAGLMVAGIYLATRGLPTAMPAAESSSWARWSERICWVFLVGYLLAIAWHQRAAPIISDDALAYHVPAAVQWLQTHRLGVFECWFHGPANIYSPLAGSTFIAWLIAPLGTDLAARYVQQPAIVFLFFACIPLLRRLGAGAIWAPVAALVVVTCRPLIVQSFIAKDDIFVTAFLVWAVLGLAGSEDGERKDVWRTARVAVALGLLLAVKYTVMMALPMLLLAVPGWKGLRERGVWRGVAVVAAGVIVLAGPWYLRNWWLAGNPLFPLKVEVAGGTIFPGLLSMMPSDSLRTASGAWAAFTATRFSLPPILTCVLVPLWLIAAVMDWRRIWSDPLRRIVYLGPPIGIAIVLLSSPYAEIRFAYPAIVLLLLGAVGLAARFVPYVTLPILLVAMIWTSFGEAELRLLALAGVAAAPLVLLYLVPKRARELGAVFAGTAVLLGLYIIVPGFVRAAELTEDVGWKGSYGKLGEAWAALRKETAREGAVVAYTGMYQVHCLHGFRLQNRAVYVPVRPDVKDSRDVPPAPGVLKSEESRPWWLEAFQAGADEQTWLKRLEASGARYFILAKVEKVAPPEAGFVGRHPERFELLFENPAAAVYRVRQVAVK